MLPLSGVHQHKLQLLLCCSGIQFNMDQALQCHCQNAHENIVGSISVTHSLRSCVKKSRLIFISSQTPNCNPDLSPPPGCIAKWSESYPNGAFGESPMAESHSSCLYNMAPEGMSEPELQHFVLWDLQPLENSFALL